MFIMPQMIYFLLGFAGLGGQVLLLRRVLVTFTGNEMTVSLLLASWTAWSGIGSWIGGAVSGRDYKARPLFNAVFAAYCLLLPATYAAAYLAKPLLGVGLSEAVGPFKISIASIVLLCPMCLTLGALFPFAARLSETGSGLAVGRTYIWEAVGAGAGGLVSSALLLPLLKPISAVFALVAIVAVFMAASGERKHRLPWLIAALPVIALVFHPRPDNMLKSARWKGFPLAAQKDSRYANLALVEREGEATLFIDGVPSITWPGGAPAEETAHIAMLSHPNPKRVLLVGGGLTTVGAEILKYPVERLDYCQIDPSIIEVEMRVCRDMKRFCAGPQGSPFDDPRVIIHLADGRRFIMGEAKGSYDVIVIAAGNPETLAANRYFTAGMFAAVKRALARPGILAFAAGDYSNYIGPLLAKYIGCVYSTLATQFDKISVFPLERFYFLAGAGVTPPSGPEYFERELLARGAPTTWFKPEVFVPDLSPERMASVRQITSGRPSGDVNEDFHPIGYTLGTAYRSTLFSDSERNAVMDTFSLKPYMAVIAVVLLFACGIAIISRGPGAANRFAPMSLAAGMGFSEMVLSVSVLYAAQVRLGTLFSLMGYLITALMAGLAAGGLIADSMPAKFLRKALVSASALLAVTLLAMIPLLSMVLPSLSGSWSVGLLTALALAGSGSSGAIYAAAALLGEAHEDHAGRLGGRINGADLVGSALGALLAGTVMIPLWGFAMTLALAALAMAAALALYLAGTRREV